MKSVKVRVHLRHIKPPFMVLVNGGKLRESAAEKLNDFLEEYDKNPKLNKVIVLEADPGAVIDVVAIKPDGRV